MSTITFSSNKTTSPVSTHGHTFSWGIPNWTPTTKDQSHYLYTGSAPIQSTEQRDRFFELMKRDRPNRTTTQIQATSAGNWGMLNSLAEIDEFRALENDWDSYGSGPPTSDAANMAASLVLYAWMIDTNSPNSEPLDIAPLADGGMQVEWKNGLNAIEVEIDRDGSLHFLTETEGQTTYVTRSGSVAQWGEVIQAIARVIR